MCLQAKKSSCAMASESRFSSRGSSPPRRSLSARASRPLSLSPPRDSGRSSSYGYSSLAAGSGSFSAPPPPGYSRFEAPPAAASASLYPPPFPSAAYHVAEDDGAPERGGKRPCVLTAHHKYPLLPSSTHPGPRPLPGYGRAAANADVFASSPPYPPGPYSSFAGFPQARRAGGSCTLKPSPSFLTETAMERDDARPEDAHWAASGSRERREREKSRSRSVSNISSRSACSLSPPRQKSFSSSPLSLHLGAAARMRDDRVCGERDTGFDARRGDRERLSALSSVARGERKQEAAEGREDGKENSGRHVAEGDERHPVVEKAGRAAASGRGPVGGSEGALDLSPADKRAEEKAGRQTGGASASSAAGKNARAALSPARARNVGDASDGTRGGDRSGGAAGHDSHETEDAGASASLRTLPPTPTEGKRTPRRSLSPASRASSTSFLSDCEPGGGRAEEGPRGAEREGRDPGGGAGGGAFGCLSRRDSFSKNAGGQRGGGGRREGGLPPPAGGCLFSPSAVTALVPTGAPRRRRQRRREGFRGSRSRSLSPSLAPASRGPRRDEGGEAEQRPLRDADLEKPAGGPRRFNSDLDKNGASPVAAAAVARDLADGRRPSLDDRRSSLSPDGYLPPYSEDAPLGASRERGFYLGADGRGGGAAGSRLSSSSSSGVGSRDRGERAGAYGYPPFSSSSSSSSFVGPRAEERGRRRGRLPEEDAPLPSTSFSPGAAPLHSVGSGAGGSTRTGGSGRGGGGAAFSSARPLSASPPPDGPLYPPRPSTLPRILPPPFSPSFSPGKSRAAAVPPFPSSVSSRPLLSPPGSFPTSLSSPLLPTPDTRGPVFGSSFSPPFSSPAFPPAPGSRLYPPVEGRRGDEGDEDLPPLHAAHRRRRLPSPAYGHADGVCGGDEAEGRERRPRRLSPSASPSPAAGVFLPTSAFAVGGRRKATFDRCGGGGGRRGLEAEEGKRAAQPDVEGDCSGFTNTDLLFARVTSSRGPPRVESCVELVTRPGGGAPSRRGDALGGGGDEEENGKKMRLADDGPAGEGGGRALELRGAARRETHHRGGRAGDPRDRVMRNQDDAGRGERERSPSSGREKRRSRSLLPSAGDAEGRDGRRRLFSPAEARGHEFSALGDGVAERGTRAARTREKTDHQAGARRRRLSSLSLLSSPYNSHNRRARKRGEREDAREEWRREQEIGKPPGGREETERSTQAWRRASHSRVSSLSPAARDSCQREDDLEERTSGEGEGERHNGTGEARRRSADSESARKQRGAALPRSRRSSSSVHPRDKEDARGEDGAWRPRTASAARLAGAKEPHRGERDDDDREGENRSPLSDRKTDEKPRQKLDEEARETPLPGDPFARRGREKRGEARERRRDSAEAAAAPAALRKREGDDRVSKEKRGALLSRCSSSSLSSSSAEGEGGARGGEARGVRSNRERENRKRRRGEDLGGDRDDGSSSASSARGDERVSVRGGRGAASPKGEERERRSGADAKRRREEDRASPEARRDASRKPYMTIRRSGDARDEDKLTGKVKARLAGEGDSKGNKALASEEGRRRSLLDRENDDSSPASLPLSAAEERERRLLLQERRRSLFEKQKEERARLPSSSASSRLPSLERRRGFEGLGLKRRRDAEEASGEREREDERRERRGSLRCRSPSPASSSSRQTGVDGCASYRPPAGGVRERERRVSGGKRAEGATSALRAPLDRVRDEDRCDPRRGEEGDEFHSPRSVTDGDAKQLLARRGRSPSPLLPHPSRLSLASFPRFSGAGASCFDKDRGDDEFAQNERERERRRDCEDAAKASEGRGEPFSPSYAPSMVRQHSPALAYLRVSSPSRFHGDHDELPPRGDRRRGGSAGCPVSPSSFSISFARGRGFRDAEGCGGDGDADRGIGHASPSARCADHGERDARGRSSEEGREAQARGSCPSSSLARTRLYSPREGRLGGGGGGHRGQSLERRESGLRDDEFLRGDGKAAAAYDEFVGGRTVSASSLPREDAYESFPTQARRSPGRRPLGARWGRDDDCGLGEEEDDVRGRCRRDREDRRDANEREDGDEERFKMAERRRRFNELKLSSLASSSFSFASSGRGRSKSPAASSPAAAGGKAAAPRGFSAAASGDDLRASPPRASASSSSASASSSSASPRGALLRRSSDEGLCGELLPDGVPRRERDFSEEARRDLRDDACAPALSRLRERERDAPVAKLPSGGRWNADGLEARRARRRANEEDFAERDRDEKEAFFATSRGEDRARGRALPPGEQGLLGPPLRLSLPTARSPKEGERGEREKTAMGVSRVCRRLRLFCCGASPRRSLLPPPLTPACCPIALAAAPVFLPVPSAPLPPSSRPPPSSFSSFSSFSSSFASPASAPPLLPRPPSPLRAGSGREGLSEAFAPPDHPLGAKGSAAVDRLSLSPSAGLQPPRAFSPAGPSPRSHPASSFHAPGAFAGASSLQGSALPGAAAAAAVPPRILQRELSEEEKERASRARAPIALDVPLAALWGGATGKPCFALPPVPESGAVEHANFLRLIRSRREANQRWKVSMREVRQREFFQGVAALEQIERINAELHWLGLAAQAIGAAVVGARSSPTSAPAPEGAPPSTARPPASPRSASFGALFFPSQAAAASSLVSPAAAAAAKNESEKTHEAKQEEGGNAARSEGNDSRETAEAQAKKANHEEEAQSDLKPERTL
ncbi:hypothetical protein BESB_084660 [Besnoitia besnoiti]|uniref:Uncharacterized protein n=1 Tax=Besnoitia besnoiti TaxID=94643 RepID=A0A2A9MCD1_BESBE|nr:hypothetical protein BESB_084660 [Besnoitia besnoiti]PFH33267.1 hypothetical protein BESB_084660 [Besnoitia besnoiti]